MVTVMETAPLAPLAVPDRNGSAPAPDGDGGAAVRERVSRPLELPPAERLDAATLGALAAVAGIAAVALGVLALLLGLGEDTSSDPASASATEATKAIGLLSKPSTERVPLAGSAGTVVLAVGSGGRSVLVLKGLEPAPSGSAYQAWVVGRARTPLQAAAFSGEERVVPLSRLVPPGGTVGVSVEDAAGVDAPTAPLLYSAQRPS
jgi:hypothetical protein